MWPFAARPRKPLRSRRPEAHLLLEGLESRSLPSTLTPVTFADRPGAGSLRYAVGQANTTVGDSTIQLAAGTYTLSYGELVLTGFSHTVTIQGAGAGQTVIDA